MTPLRSASGRTSSSTTSVPPWMIGAPVAEQNLSLGQSAVTLAGYGIGAHRLLHQLQASRRERADGVRGDGHEPA